MKYIKRKGILNNILLLVILVIMSLNFYIKYQALDHKYINVSTSSYVYMFITLVILYFAIRNNLRYQAILMMVFLAYLIELFLLTASIDLNNLVFKLKYKNNILITLSTSVSWSVVYSMTTILWFFFVVNLFNKMESWIIVKKHLKITYPLLIIFQMIFFIALISIRRAIDFNSDVIAYSDNLTKQSLSIIMPLIKDIWLPILIMIGNFIGVRIFSFKDQYISLSSKVSILINYSLLLVTRKILYTQVLILFFVTLFVATNTFAIIRGYVITIKESTPREPIAYAPAIMSKDINTKVNFYIKKREMKKMKKLRKKVES